MRLNPKVLLGYAVGIVSMALVLILASATLSWICLGTEIAGYGYGIWHMFKGDGMFTRAPRRSRFQGR
jgi:hypothetical protein